MKINSFILGSLITLLFTSFQLSAQNAITIYDFDEKEVMPFVKVFPNVGQPLFSDIDGVILVPTDVESLQLHFAGYSDTIVRVSEIQQNSIFYKSIPISIGEVVILPGENPALRIIHQAIENRKKNHPLENDAFSYESYSKFVFDLDSTSQKVAKSITNDTSGIIKFINSQHLFMLESISERKFIPPARDRENIIAYKASGINNPILSTFAQSIQSFHFYDNQFDLMGTKYFSPIALGAPKKYYYLLQDTTIVGTDTTFTISFRPRPDVTINALEGTLFINTNGFAIERVIASPAKDKSAMTYVKIVQEYKLLNDKKWFPNDLKINVQMKGAQISVGESSGFLEGIGRTTIKNVQLNPANLKKNGFNNIALSTDPKAGDLSDAEWDALRKNGLSAKESRTYEMLDSVSKAENFDKKLNTIIALSTGKIPLGYFALPLDRIIDFNYHEGYRIGLGLETSEKLMKNIIVGGYFAYGTRDKDWKYGGNVLFHLNKRLGMSINASFQQDVLNRGSNDMTRTNWDILGSTFLTDFYQKFMDRQRKAQLQFTIAPLGNLTFHVAANYQRIEFTRNYLYTNTINETISQLDVAETNVEMNWNIRQRILVLGNIRMPQPTKFPKINLKIAKGWSGIVNSSTDYIRAFIAVNEDLENVRFGKLNIHAEASQTFGETPLIFKQYAVGTRQDWNFVTSNALETVYPGEFYHDRQASFIARYSFPVIKTKKKWFAPEFTIHHGLGYGDMKDKTAHNMQFWTMDKGVFEGGLIMSGILNIQFLKVGLAAFYRYGYYSDTNALKNIVPKISLRFGAFGK